MQPRTHHNSIKPVRGFTLIEVLVAVLVIAIGMLGIAALIVQGVKYNHDAFLRSQVSTLVNAMADRIRLNSANAIQYVTNYTAQPVLGGGATNQVCNYNGGTSAANDLACWKNEVDNAMPPGSTAVIQAIGNLYTITLSWQSRENAPPHSVDYTFQCTASAC
jgi:type IV pilus assembly protein PilV